MPGLSTIRQVAVRHVAGGICGTSASGLPTIWSVGLKIASKVWRSFVNTPDHVHDDGLVPFETSCKLPGKPYSKDYKSAYYQAPMDTVPRFCDSDGSGGDSILADTLEGVGAVQAAVTEVIGGQVPSLSLAQVPGDPEEEEALNRKLLNKRPAICTIKIR